MPSLKGHVQTVFVLTFSHDGKLLASGGADSQVIIWDLSAFKQKVMIDHKEDDNDVRIRTVQFFQNSEKLITAGSNKTIKIFNIFQLPQWELLRQLEDHGDEIIKLKFSIDEKTLYSIDTNGYVIIWEVEKIFQNENLEMRNLINLIFTSSGQFFFAIDSKKKIIGFYDFKTKSCLNFVPITNFTFVKLTISRDDKYLASASEDGLVVIWDVSQKPFKLIWYQENFLQIIDFSFSPDNQILSILCDNIIVNKQFKNQVQSEEQFTYKNCDSIAFDDNLLALLGKKIIHHIDMITNQAVNSISFLNEGENEYFYWTEQKLNFSINHQLAYQYRQEFMSFWDMNTCQKLFEINTQNDKVTLLSKNQIWLVDSVYYSEYLIIQNLEKKSQKQFQKNFVTFLSNKPVTIFTITFKGSLIALFCEYKKKIIIKNLNNSKTECQEFSLEQTPKCLAFSHQGKYLLYGYYSVFLIEINTNKKEEFKANECEVQHLATSFDDKILGAADGIQIFLWNINTKEIIIIEKIDCDTRLLFSPINENIAFGFQNKVFIFDYSTKVSKVMHAHDKAVIDLAFSFNHQYFASIGDDSTIILHNLITPKIIKTQQLEANLISIHFIQSQNLLTLSKEFIKIWKITSEDELELQRVKLNFKISQIQYEFYTKNIYILLNRRIMLYYFDDFQDFIILKQGNEGSSITISDDKKLIGYDCGKQIKIQELKEDANGFDLNTGESSHALAFSSFGKFFATFGKSHCLKIWNLELKEIIESFGMLNEIIKEISFNEKNEYLFCKGSNSMIFDISNIEAIRPIETFFQRQYEDQQAYNFIQLEEVKYNNFFVINKKFFGFNQRNKGTIIKKLQINNNQSFYSGLPIFSNKFCYSWKNYLAVGDQFQLLIFHLHNQNQNKTYSNIRAFEFTKDEKILVLMNKERYEYILKIIDPENGFEQILQNVSKLTFHDPKNCRLLQDSSAVIIISERQVDIFKIQDQLVHFIGKMYSNNLKFITANSHSHFGFSYKKYSQCLSIDNLEQKEFLHSTSSPTSMDISYDQKFLVLSSKEGLKLWNMEQLTFEQKECESQNSIFITNNQIIYNNDTKLFLCSVEQFNINLEIGQSSKIIKTIEYSKQNDQLIIADNSQKIILWDIKSRSQLTTFQGHSQEIQSIVFSPQGQMIASGGQDKLIRLWNANANQNLTTSQDHHIEKITCLRFSPDGLILASSSADNTIKLWSITNFQYLCVLRAHAELVQNIIFSSDQQFLLSNDRSNIILWDITNLNNIQSVFIVKNFSKDIRQVLFQKNGDVLFLHSSVKNYYQNGSEKQKISSYFWILQNNIERTKKEIMIDVVQSYQVVQNQSSIAYLENGQIIIINLQSKQSQRFAESNIIQFVFSDDNKKLATVTQKFELSFWAGSLEQKWEKYHSISLKYQFDKNTLYLKFSHDNKQLNFISDTTFSSYIIQSTDQVQELQIEKLFTEIQFFAVDQSRNVFILAHQIQTPTVSFYITILKLADFQLIKTFKGYQSEIQAVSFSFDGKYFSAGCKDGKIYVWNYLTEILDYQPYETILQVYSITFTQNVEHILISCNCENVFYKFTKIDLLNQEQTKLNLIQDVKPPLSPFGNLFLSYHHSGLALFTLDIKTNQYQQNQIIFFKNKDYSSHQFNANQTLVAIEFTWGSLIVQDIQKKERVYFFQQQLIINQFLQRRINFSLDNKIVLVWQGKILFRVGAQFEEDQKCQDNYFYFQSEILHCLAIKDDEFFILTNEKIIQKIKTQPNNILRRQFYEDATYLDPILVKTDKLYVKYKYHICVYDTINMIIDHNLWLRCDIFNISSDEQLLFFAEEGYFIIAKCADIIETRERRFYSLMAFCKANNIQTHNHDKSEDIKSLIISQNQRVLATKSDICTKLWDISDITNPQIKFILLGESKNEQFTCDSLYFCRQFNNQLFYLEIEKFLLEEITYKKIEDQQQFCLMKQNEADSNQLLLVTVQHLFHYDINSEKINKIYKFEPDAFFFKFSDSSTILAYQANKKKQNIEKNIIILEIRNLEIKSSILEHAHSDDIDAISFLLDGALMLSGSRDCIKVWDLENQKQLAMINNLSDLLKCLEFSPDGVHFASGSMNGAVSLYITNISKKEIMKKKVNLLKKSLGDVNCIGCLKEISQQPLLQKSNCREQNLMINLENPSLIALFEQKQ